jgi:hypothetical protein
MYMYKPTLLDESEAELIRPRMREDRERELRGRSFYRSTHGNNEMICTICKQKSSFKNLWQHVKRDHGKNKPANGDIVPTIDSNHHIPPVYWHWPPRDDGEEGEAVLNDSGMSDSDSL